MFDAKRKNQLGVRIMLGFIVGILGAGMLVYLIPGQGTASTPTADVVATVGNDQVTVNDVRTQLTRIQTTGAIPPALQSLYAQQVLNQLVFAKELEIEAQRLGIQVTDQERADRIRELVPTAFVGDTFVGLDQYAAQIQQRAGHERAGIRGPHHAGHDRGEIPPVGDRRNDRLARRRSKRSFAGGTRR